MMSSATLLDQTFDSESEDDNFNPAPAEDSDNDAAGDFDNHENTAMNGDQNRRPSLPQPTSEEDEAESIAQNSALGRVNGNGPLEPKSEDDEDIKQDRNNGLDGGADDEDDEDEEEEDEEEEAISV